MLGPIRQIAAGSILLIVALLINAQSASGRRPSNLISKTYASGKFVGSSTQNGAASVNDAKVQSRDSSLSGRHARIEKPLHASLPHATRQASGLAVKLAAA